MRSLPDRVGRGVLSLLKQTRVLRLSLLLLLIIAGILLYTERRAALEQAERVLAAQLSALLGERVTFESVELDVLELSVRAKNLRVDSYLPDEPGPLLQIESLSARLAAIPTSSHIHIRSIDIVRPTVRLALEGGRLVHFPGLQELLSKPKEEGPKKRFDLDALTVEGGIISAADKTKGWSVSLFNVQGALGIVDGKPGRVSLQLGRAEVRVAHLNEDLEVLRVEANLVASPARLHDLYLKLPDAEVRAEGTFRLKEVPGEPRASLLVKVAGDLAMLERVLPRSPHLEGRVKAAGTFTYTDTFHSAGNLEFEDLVVDRFKIGDGGAEYDLTPERVRADSIVLPRGDGMIVANGELGLKDRLPIQVQADLEDVRLGELLEDLSLEDAWVQMVASGRAEVEGHLLRPFGLTGHLELDARSFGVWPHSYKRATPATRMMGLSQGKLTGDVQIDARKVEVLRGALLTPRSKIYIDGAIGIKGWLDLALDAVDLDLSEISPLAGFELAGRGWGKGRVEGPFSALVVAMDASLFGARFDEYALGDLEGYFLAPLNSTKYLQRLSAPEGTTGDPGSGKAAVVDPEGLPRLARTLAEVDRRYYEGRMVKRSPPILMLPDVRTRVGRTRIRGQGAIVFMDPYIVTGDFILPSGVGGKAPEGQLADVLSIPQLELEGDPLDGALGGRVTVMGPPLELDGDARLELVKGMIYGQPVRSAEASLRLERGGLVVDSLLASTGKGELVLSGSLGRDGAVQATAEVTGLPLEEVGALEGVALAATGNGVLTVKGSLEEPELQGQVSLAGMTWQGKPLGDTALTLSTASRTLLIQGLLLGENGRIAATVGLLGELPYEATLVVSSLPLDPYLAQDAEAGELTRVRVGGTVRAQGELNGDASVQLDAGLEELAVSHGSLSLNNVGPVAIVMRDGRLRLGPARLEGDQTALSIEGTIEPDSAVDLYLGGSFNLALLDALLPGIFQRIEGRVLFSGAADRRPGTPAGFRIGGTLDALRFEGVATLEEAALRTIFFPPTIDQLSGSIRVADNNAIYIDRLAGNLGGGSITGQGVMILGPAYYPRHYDLEVVGKDAFIRYPSFLPPGLMDARITFNGDVGGNLVMGGDVDLQRMVYRDRYNWEKVLTDFRTYRLESIEAPVNEPPLFNIDVRIHAPGTFFIRNNLGNIQLKGDLHLVGDTNVMELYGDVESQRGTVTILDNTFDLTNGKIEFRGDYWNPGLDLRMQTEIQSYTIWYEVTGTLQDWKLTPGSDSGLSERDINSLIAFRTLADNITEGNEARAVAAPALEFLIGRLGILEQLQAFTRLDRFTIVPATDQSGNMGARVYGEKELAPSRLFASGYYDYAINGSQEFLVDLELKAFSCCSVVLRLDNSGQAVTSPTSVNPGLRLKLKMEFE